VISPPAPAAPVTPVAGQMTTRTQGEHGAVPFALVGERLVVRGSVAPYVAGQQVTVRFVLDGRGVATRTAAVAFSAGGVGRFRVTYASPRPGLLGVSATHTATPQLAALAAHSGDLRVVPADMREGVRGPGVRLLQQRLGALHYAVPRSGVFDEGTGQAVIAYRKLNGLTRVPTVDAQVMHLLQRSSGRFPVRFPRQGRHIEASLARQVLAEIEPGGRVYRIYTTSSGKPSTPTVLGQFHVYLKTPGVNSEGMVDSNYFIRGYAIHGYPEVPTYAASHGCLRVPIPDAPAIFSWVRLGTPVDVYE
jgi:hypothetical protein